MADKKEVSNAELGRMTVKTHFTLQPNAVPKSIPARPISNALLPEVNDESDRWISEGIYEKVEPSYKTSGWGAPFVPVPKPSGKVRL